MQERLQKLISTAGIASRRDAEELIIQGRVLVNGKRASLGDKADPAIDDIRVDGERLNIRAKRTYIMVNKPMQVVTAVSAQRQEKRPTVRDIVPVKGYLYPVGRLDADSEGLVLLTDDGDLAQQLTHPRYEHSRVYRVTVHGRITDDSLDIWRRGMVLEDGPTQPAEIKVIERDSKYSVLQVTMKEGRKRQIRRVASKLGHPVQSLVRSHLATLALGDLKPGEWRYLDESEIKALKASAASGERLAKSAAARPPRQPGANSETREARRARKAAQPGSRTALRNANNEEHPRRTGTGRPASRSGSRTIGKPGGAARSGRKSGQPGRVLTNRPNPPKKRSGRRTRTE